ncbi:Glutamyl-tRNA(Gln) amidotransferase subunit A [Baekduia alba]|uniref:amidase family protein n=1 Tax=Baekduia alba TaxID=2997333 RepID=UPI002341C230|nr:amidase family protein [Baekduia alba]WCB91516.1 Glutamyl-tRNA(Gln) amidotransferase subunit A [Baekduia alba]
MSFATSNLTVGDVGLEGATILDLQQAFTTGALTSETLTRFYLQRIERLNPDLNAVLFVNPSALLDARHSDERRRSGRRLSPLDGIPVLLKDNIATAGMPTTVGSYALLHADPADDAEVVIRLRNAGAVILGKANLDEWAGYRSVDVVSGWSAVGGQIRNPYVLDRDPWGSSGGAAVAVSAHLTTVAIGAKTDGSLMNPAGANGVVAIQPTVGLVSRRGIVPVCPAQDTAGPIARTVTDAAIVLSVIQSGRGAPVDASMVSHPRGLVSGPGSLHAKRIGVWLPRGGGGSLPEAMVAARDQLLEEAVATLEANGATIIRGIDLNVDAAVELSRAVGLVELKAAINRYLGSRTGPCPADLEALIAFNDEHAEREMPLFGQDVFHAAQDMQGDPTDAAWRDQRRAVTDMARMVVDEALRRHHLDAIVAPTNTPSLPPLDRAGIQSARPSAIAGYPAISVPAGLAFGVLPVGLTFFGGPSTEQELLMMARAFEQVTAARRAPTFRPQLQSPAQ